MRDGPSLRAGPARVPEAPEGARPELRSRLPALGAREPVPPLLTPSAALPALLAPRSAPRGGRRAARESPTEAPGTCRCQWRGSSLPTALPAQEEMPGPPGGDTCDAPHFPREHWAGAYSRGLPEFRPHRLPAALPPSHAQRAGAGLGPEPCSPPHTPVMRKQLARPPWPDRPPVQHGSEGRRGRTHWPLAPRLPSKSGVKGNTNRTFPPPQAGGGRHRSKCGLRRGACG